MSWATCIDEECKGASNNIHFNYPPLMSDGRNFVNWNPACQINDRMRRNYGIKSNYEYRQFLMSNADRIIRQNQISACNQCGVCEREFARPSPEEEYMEQRKPQYYLYDSCRQQQAPYGYEHSDLKSLYLSRQQLQSQYNAPIMSQAEYYDRYHR